jgi:hypothetical protein
LIAESSSGVLSLLGLAFLGIALAVREFLVRPMPAQEIIEDYKQGVQQAAQQRASDARKAQGASCGR